MADKALYCYSHNIDFDTVELFDQHRLDCPNLIEIPYLCTQHREDGGMCGRQFAASEGLKEHALAAHNVYLCGICDMQSVQPLVGHVHKQKDVNVHACK